MKTCTTCGKQHADAVMFCDACGTKLAAAATNAAPQQPTKFCNVCGKQLPANAAFCDACGNKFGYAPKASAGITPAMISLFKFIASASVKVSAFFAALSILFFDYGWEGIEVQPVCAIFALIFGLAAAGLEVTVFLNDKKNKDDLFTRIGGMVPAGLVAIFSLILMFNL